MSATTPADLAVTFRSLARRRREAIGDADPGALRSLAAELDAHVAAAGAALGVTDASAEAIADAIDARPADRWDEATLETLRAEALAAGSALRRLADAADDLQR